MCLHVYSLFHFGNKSELVLCSEDFEVNSHYKRFQLHKLVWWRHEWLEARPWVVSFFHLATSNSTCTSFLWYHCFLLISEGMIFAKDPSRCWTSVKYERFIKICIWQIFFCVWWTEIPVKLLLQLEILVNIPDVQSDADAESPSCASIQALVQREEKVSTSTPVRMSFVCFLGHTELFQQSLVAMSECNCSLLDCCLSHTDVGKLC